ncbi:DNA-binding protein [Salmonella enterica subsp. diarizonae]|nr:DNA-binding protein [Salmonella enterica subsp. diarizonae]EDY5734546.1 H-NS histone family protein [Salmonella enterica]
MGETLKVLNNIRTLRAQAREIDLVMLEEMLEKLTTIVEDRREEEASLRQQQEERQAKLEAFRQKMLEDGIDPAELLSTVSSSPSKAGAKRTPRPAKYKYIDTDGSEKTWTGQGRTPRAIAAALESGKTLEDFEIK